MGHDPAGHNALSPSPLRQSTECQREAGPGASGASAPGDASAVAGRRGAGGARSISSTTSAAASWTRRKAARPAAPLKLEADVPQSTSEARHESSVASRCRRRDMRRGMTSVVAIEVLLRCTPGANCTLCVIRCKSAVSRATTRSMRSASPVVVCASMTSGMAPIAAQTESICCCDTDRVTKASRGRPIAAGERGSLGVPSDPPSRSLFRRACTVFRDTPVRASTASRLCI